MKFIMYFEVFEKIEIFSELKINFILYEIVKSNVSQYKGI